MRIKFLYIITLFFIYTFYGCKQINNLNEFDNESYINDFELLKENPKNHSSLKITSPRAIIDTTYNDIKIFDSTIDIISRNGDDIKIKSGNSILKNSSNLIKVYNDVNISLIDSNDFYILTNSFSWDISTSNIDLNSPLDINFDNTKIYSSDGSYDINYNVLKINNNIFNRKILNINGEELYKIKILSDKAKWFKNDNSLVFISPNKQVETTIEFLSIK